MPPENTWKASWLVPVILALVLGQTLLAEAAAIAIRSPLDFQVIQRDSPDHGHLNLRGQLVDGDDKSAVIEARIVAAGSPGPWQRLKQAPSAGAFEDEMEVSAGGWHRVEVRARVGDQVVAQAAVDHFGVGEVFVVAGQSNSANHGEERQTTRTGRVATFDGQRWQAANDPQPGASGSGGSFLPPFGDAMAERFKVPIGFVACGVGATSVREWLPKGDRMTNPPTLTGNVEPIPGETGWVSKGEIYRNFISRMRSLGPDGFRAVLWHQGESDANQKDPTRTLSGTLYRDYLGRLILQSRSEIGWAAPWFVAQASYHVPGDEASVDIRQAQASLWKDGLALAGPDSDALKGEWRDSGGKGVHFSGPGLREHAARWVEKVSRWLEKQLK